VHQRASHLLTVQLRGRAALAEALAALPADPLAAHVKFEQASRPARVH